MQQYFVAGKAQDEVTITDKDTMKHMFQVMRLADGDEVVLVFDDHIKRLAKVLDSSSHRFQILETLDSDVELPVDVTIAVGFPKGDKLEFLAQKTTELGANQLWAFPADWSVVKWDGKKLAKKGDKLAKITLGAEKKADFLAGLSSFDKVFIAYEESAKEGETAALARELSRMTAGEKLLFIFGPEGGISPEEIAAFEAHGGQTIGLGPRIMRAETAPLYALSSISYALELQKSN